MNKRGLTLVELIVTVVITGLIITAGIAISLNNQQIFKKENVCIATRANTRNALAIIVEDLRLAGYNPLGTPAFDSAFIEAQDSLIEMRMDLNSDGVYDFGSEECVYMVSNDTLYKGISGLGLSVVAEDIDYLGFRYFNLDAVELASPVIPSQIDSIYAVKVIIVGKSAKGLLRHHEVGTYPDGTPYDDRHYRCWDSTLVRLRNVR